MGDRRLESESGPAKRVAEIVEPTIESLGFRLVRVKITGPGRTLQIMAERPDGTMSIDDCETVSRAISPLLDVEDPIAGSYTLEVSSPGIDRPLVRLEDFQRWAGHVAKVELKGGRDGRRRFCGVIEGTTDTAVRLALAPEDAAGGEAVVEFALDDLAAAKLVMTDELLADARRRARPGNLGDGSDWQDDATDNETTE